MICTYEHIEKNGFLRKFLKEIRRDRMSGQQPVPEWGEIPRKTYTFQALVNKNNIPYSIWVGPKPPPI